MISQELKDRIDSIIYLYIPNDEACDNGKYEDMLNAFDGCDGLTEEQLCTHVRCYYDSQIDYLVKFEHDNPPTIYGKQPHEWEGAKEWVKGPHCFTDDQGFEGSFITEDGTREGKIIFSRFFVDELHEAQRRIHNG